MELYDWRNDPDEKEDLIHAKPEIMDKMRKDIEDFYTDLLEKSSVLSPPQVLNMSPQNIERLQSLGYIR